MSFDKAALKKRMDGAVDVLTKEMTGLRTGRASTSLLEPITVEAYGSRVPISQIGTIGVPEARMLTVQVWDMSLAKTVDKAIRDSGLGLNPQTEGAMLRIPVPPLNEERRHELVKIAGKYTEQARISVRNVRRDGMDLIKKLEKDGKISEDDQKRFSDEVQKITDETIKKIDDMLAHKEKEIMVV